MKDRLLRSLLRQIELQGLLRKTLLGIGDNGELGVGAVPCHEDEVVEEQEPELPPDLVLIVLYLLLDLPEDLLDDPQQQVVLADVYEVLLLLRQEPLLYL